MDDWWRFIWWLSRNRTRWVIFLLLMYLYLFTITEFVFIFFAALMQWIERMHRRRHVDFFESIVKFKFDVCSAPVEKLCVWKTLQIRCEEISRCEESSEYFIDAQVKVIDDYNDENIKYLLFYPQGMGLYYGTSCWIPRTNYHYARITLQRVWKEGEIEVFQSIKIKFGVRRFQVMGRIKRLHFDPITDDWITAASFVFRCPDCKNNFLTTGTHCNNCGRVVDRR